MMIFHSTEILLAAHYLKKGEIVAFPTETVYGLGAPVFHIQAIEKIFLVKKRPRDNPLIVHISQFAQLDAIVHSPPPLFYQLAHHFFPGPLTILLPKKESVPSIVSADLSFIGVRMPDHILARELIDAVGEPLVAPSANLSGKPSSTTVRHVLDDFGSDIAGVIDGGPCSVGLESTVLLLTPQPTILRPGAITKEAIEQVLQQPVLYGESHSEKPLSPGMKYRHYAPQGEVKLFDDEKTLQTYIENSQNKRRLVLTKIHPKELYQLLRHSDREGYEEILIVCDDEMKKNQALMNRLQRAAQ